MKSPIARLKALRRHGCRAHRNDEVDAVLAQDPTRRQWLMGAAGVAVGTTTFAGALRPAPASAQTIVPSGIYDEIAAAVTLIGSKTFDARNAALNLGVQPQVWTANWRATDLAGGSVGWKLNRADSTYAMGLSWMTGGVVTWEQGLDAGTTDFVFAYDPDRGDQFRVAKGAHFEIGRSVGVPGLGTRVRISADDADPATLRTVQELAIGAGTNAALRNFLICSEAGVTKFSVERDGDVGIVGAAVINGTTTTPRILTSDNAGAALSDDKGAIVSNAGSLASQYNGLGFQLTGGQKWRWTSGIVNEALAGAALRSDTTGYNVLAFDGGAGAGTMKVRANLALEGGALGFFSATPAAKPTGVAVTAAGIHAALVTLGLIAA